MDVPVDSGHRRLFPSLTDPSYLVLRSRRKIFTEWFRQLSPAQLSVLDVGSRHQPYRPLMGDRVERYVALDVDKMESVTVIADGQALPFPPNSFDVVIATQVFEFFQSPHLAAQQIHDVLRPGGVLFASVATYAPRFTLRERWRFLPEGMKTILHPFKTVEIVPEVHDVGGFLRNVNLGLDTFFRFRGGRLIYRWTLCPMLNLMGVALENLDVRSTDALTCNFSVRAVK